MHRAIEHRRVKRQALDRRVGVRHLRHRHHAVDPRLFDPLEGRTILQPEPFKRLIERAGGQFVRTLDLGRGRRGRLDRRLADHAESVEAKIGAGQAASAFNADLTGALVIGDAGFDRLAILQHHRTQDFELAQLREAMNLATCG